MAVDEQKFLVTLYFKKKLRARTAELINSGNSSTRGVFKVLLEMHFGYQRDLKSLISDLSRLKQLPDESHLTFVSMLQSHTKTTSTQTIH